MRRGDVVLPALQELMNKEVCAGANRGGGERERDKGGERETRGEREGQGGGRERDKGEGEPWAWYSPHCKREYRGRGHTC